MCVCVCMSDRINPSMIKMAARRARASLPSLLFLSYQREEPPPTPRATIRFRLHCLRRGLPSLFARAGALRKPPLLFPAARRRVKLSERHPYRKEEGAWVPSACTTMYTRYAQIPCFQVGVYGGQRAALYQVWVKLLEHQTPRELLYRFSSWRERARPRSNGIHRARRGGSGEVPL